ncbi:MAG: 5-formyltetrahydrofolate cyclo-ligase [Bacteroidota bacterium]
MNTGHRKAALRKSLLAQRAAVQPAHRREWSAAISTHIAGLPAIQSAQTIHCFWPMEDRGEVDLAPFVEHQWRAGTRIVLPVMQPNGRLEHREFKGRAHLVTNRWGVSEPLTGALVLPSELDCVIVPGLAFDKRGYRLGYGKGFYDRFLADLNVPTIGVCFSQFLLDELPFDAYDVPVSSVVTERST